MERLPKVSTVVNGQIKTIPPRMKDAYARSPITSKVKKEKYIPMSTTQPPFALSLSRDWISSFTYLRTRGSYSRSDSEAKATSQIRRFHECPSGYLSIIMCTVDESPRCVPSYQEPLLRGLVDPKIVFTVLRLQTSSSRGPTRTKSPCFS
jgi:hypothetical protein